MEEKTPLIPVDDIIDRYGESSDIHKRAVSSLLPAEAFLVQTKEDYTAISSNIHEAFDMFVTLMLQLKEEFGHTFVKSLAISLLTSLSEQDRLLVLQEVEKQSELEEEEF